MMFGCVTLRHIVITITFLYIDKDIFPIFPSFVEDRTVLFNFCLIFVL